MALLVNLRTTLFPLDKVVAPPRTSLRLLTEVSAPPLRLYVMSLLYGAEAVPTLVTPNWKENVFKLNKEHVVQ